MIVIVPQINPTGIKTAAPANLVQLAVPIVQIGVAANAMMRMVVRAALSGPWPDAIAEPQSGMSQKRNVRVPVAGHSCQSEVNKLEPAIVDPQKFGIPMRSSVELAPPDLIQKLRTAVRLAIVVKVHSQKIVGTALEQTVTERWIIQVNC